MRPCARRRLGLSGAVADLKGDRTRRAALAEGDLRCLPLNREPNWLSVGNKTYPDGYAIEELGTFPPAVARDA